MPRTYRVVNKRLSNGTGSVPIPIIDHKYVLCSSSNVQSTMEGSVLSSFLSFLSVLFFFYIFLPVQPSSSSSLHFLPSLIAEPLVLLSASGRILGGGIRRVEFLAGELSSMSKGVGCPTAYLVTRCLARYSQGHETRHILAAVVAVAAAAAAIETRRGGARDGGGRVAPRNCQLTFLPPCKKTRSYIPRSHVDTCPTAGPGRAGHDRVPRDRESAEI